MDVKSNVGVYGALAANIEVAIINFIAASVTGDDDNGNDDITPGPGSKKVSPLFKRSL